MTPLEGLKLELNEKEFPHFNDEELQYYLDKYEDFDLTLYYCAKMKAQNTEVTFSEGMVTPDQSEYFMKVALIAYDRWRGRNNQSGVK
jgi:hypothetical protein